MIRSTLLGLILGVALASGLVEAWSGVKGKQAEIERVARTYCEQTHDSRCR